MNYVIDSTIADRHPQNFQQIDFNLVNQLAGKIKDYFRVNILNLDFYSIESKQIISRAIQESKGWNMPENVYSVDKYYLKTNKIRTIPQIKFIPLCSRLTKKWILKFKLCTILDQPNLTKYFIYSTDENFDTTIQENFDFFLDSNVFNKEESEKSVENKNSYILKNIDNEIIDLELLIAKYKILKHDYLK